MKHYRNLQWRIVFVFIVYTAVSLYAKAHMGDELFPFFNWSLFTKIPNEKNDYGLRITMIEGEALESPIYFESADDWLAEAHSIVAYNAIQDFGRAVRDEDEALVAEIRPYIESLYLENKPMRYDVVRRTYTPLERWQTGEFANEALLGQFTIDGGAP